MTYSKEMVDLKFAKSAYWNFLLWGDLLFTWNDDIDLR